MVAATTHWSENYKIGCNEVNSTDTGIKFDVVFGFTETDPLHMFWALTSGPPLLINITQRKRK